MMIDDGTFVKGNNWFWGRRAIVESVRGIYLFLAKTYACFESRGEILIYFKIVGKKAVFIMMIDSRCVSKPWDSSSDHVCGVI